MPYRERWLVIISYAAYTSQLPFLYCSEKLFIRANQCPDTTVDLFICDVVLVSDVKNPSIASHSMNWILLSSSAVSVHVSQPNRKTEMTNECRSLIFVWSEMVLSFQISSSFESAATDCAIWVRTSGALWTDDTVIVEPGFDRFCMSVLSLSWIMGVSRAKESLVELIPLQAWWPQPSTMYPYGSTWP